MSHIAYYGGKERLAADIIPNLPTNTFRYIEPFAGMCSVLLRRSRVPVEIVNDINSRIVNLLLQIRDNSEWLTRKWEQTPYARDIYNDAFDTIDEGHPEERALKMLVVIEQSLMHSDGFKSFAMVYNRDHINGYLHAHDIKRIQARLQHVAIENTDAIKLLKRVAKYNDATIYIDPPYQYTNNEAYSNNAVNYQELADVMISQQGAVAISGYNDEWDHLGWYKKYEKQHRLLAGNQTHNVKRSRTECLWINDECARRIQGRLM